MNKFGGKWKVLVMYGISEGYNRFSSLQKVIPHISKQMLINQLREMEEDGILARKIFPQIPPRVEYTLTTYGLSTMPLLLAIAAWGTEDMKPSSILI